MRVDTIIASGVVPTLCRMCDTRCAINVHIDNNVMTKISPMEGHPINRGRICPRSAAALDLFYHTDRILKPLKFFSVNNRNATTHYVGRLSSRGGEFKV